MYIREFKHRWYHIHRADYCLKHLKLVSIEKCFYFQFLPTANFALVDQISVHPPDWYIPLVLWSLKEISSLYWSKEIRKQTLKLQSVLIRHFISFGKFEKNTFLLIMIQGDHLNMAVDFCYLGKSDIVYKAYTGQVNFNKIQEKHGHV